jgi:hypothetical protein
MARFLPFAAGSDWRSQQQAREPSGDQPEPSEQRG